MIEPRRAPVKPRGVSPAAGAVLPLEDEIEELLRAGKRGTVQIVGGAGMGKTTALQHLAAVLPADANVALLDEPNSVQVSQAANERLVVYTSGAPGSDHPTLRFRLPRWGKDEFIEYLLAEHPDRCASVMARIRDSDRELLNGIPQLCRIALDQLASDAELPDVRSALVRFVA